MLKNSNRVLINDKNELSIDSEDVPGLEETKLWTPDYILEIPLCWRIVKRTRV